MKRRHERTQEADKPTTVVGSTPGGGTDWESHEERLNGCKHNVTRGPAGDGRKRVTSHDSQYVISIKADSMKHV